MWCISLSVDDINVLLVASNFFPSRTSIPNVVIKGPLSTNSNVIVFFEGSNSRSL